MPLATTFCAKLYAVARSGGRAGVFTLSLQKAGKASKGTSSQLVSLLGRHFESSKRQWFEFLNIVLTGWTRNPF